MGYFEKFDGLWWTPGPQLNFNEVCTPGPGHRSRMACHSVAMGICQEQYVARTNISRGREIGIRANVNTTTAPTRILLQHETTENYMRFAWKRPGKKYKPAKIPEVLSKSTLYYYVRNSPY